MAVKKILILGSSGLLGSSLANFFISNKIDFLRHSREKGSILSADLTNSQAALSMLREINPDVVINLTGLTDVDYCQRNLQDAYLSNVKIIENLKPFFISINQNPHLIHISTDHVYDQPYPSQIDEINIKNFYAFSKYAGELAALSVSGNVSILRTNFCGFSLCSKRKSFTDWLYQAAKNQTDIKVFDDVKFSPLSMHSLSYYINQIIENGPTGLINLGSRDGMSKADFAYAFIDKLGLDSSFMTRVNSIDLDLVQIPRPMDMRMDSTSFEKIFNCKLPTLKEEIESIAEDYYEQT